MTKGSLFVELTKEKNSMEENMMLLITYLSKYATKRTDVFEDILDNKDVKKDAAEASYLHSELMYNYDKEEEKAAKISY